jgi:hypothetical protein
MNTKGILARQKADRFPERLRELLFLEVAHQNPIVQDDDVMGSSVCYWCDNAEYEGHRRDCLWALVKETYDKTFMTGDEV